MRNDRMRDGGEAKARCKFGVVLLVNELFVEILVKNEKKKGVLAFMAALNVYIEYLLTFQNLNEYKTHLLAMSNW